MEELKKIAGVTAAKYVEDGMVVGLGTGSTAYFFVEEIGRRIKEEGLSVVGVTTSSQTTKQAEGLGIPLKAVDRPAGQGETGKTYRLARRGTQVVQQGQA